MNRARISRPIFFYFVFSLVCALSLVLATPLTAVQAAPVHTDDDSEWTGVLESRPQAQLHGQWMVSGRAFVATESTEFDDDDELAVGVCVEVEYWTDGEGAHFATEIEVAHDACDDNGDDSNDDGDDDDDDGSEVTGIIESRPLDGLLGLWVVGGHTFVATAQTEFEDRNELQVDTCAEVEYWLNHEGTRFALEIEAEGDGCQDDDGDTDTQEVYGHIEVFPGPGLEGEWVIDGTVYLANDDTEFEQDHGPFGAGACVEVEFVAGSPAVAVEIETEAGFKCRDDDSSHATGELYGVIQDLPEDLMGEWQIGGLVFTVDSQTELESDDVQFEAGVLVEVEFYVSSEGRLIATEIEAKLKVHGDDDGDGDEDGDDSDSHEGNGGHAIGSLDSLAVGGDVSIWIIGGVHYRITDSTRLIEVDGTLTVDTTVRVKYYVDQDGNRVALSVKSVGAGNAGAGIDEHRLYGFVEAKPVDSFVGVWIVNGVKLIADQSTTFDETRAVLAATTFVEVAYTISNGEKHVSLIETHVPPGAGSETRLGTIQSIDAGISGRTGHASGSVWVIGGVEYTVLDATDLDETSGDLHVGSQAVVDSYVDSSGARTATQVRQTTLDEFLYLPLTVR